MAPIRKGEAVITPEQIEKYRAILKGETGDNQQSKTLDALGSDGTPRSISLLLETLTYPVFALKEDCLKMLLNIDQHIVYEGLLLIMQKAEPDLLNQLIDLSKNLSLAPKLLERMEQWKGDPGRFKDIVNGLKIIGFMADKSAIGIVSSYLYHLDLSIKKSAVDVLRSIGSPDCLNVIFPPLKLANDELALYILDLIGLFHVQKSILPLLYLVGSSHQAVQEKILEIIKSYPAEEVDEVVNSNCKKSDVDFCQAALKVYEAMGRLDAAREIREKYNVTGEITPTKENKEAAEQLQLQIKTTGDVALLALAGIVDVYSLPKLTRKIEHLVTKGHLKVLLFCEQVKKIDTESLKRINSLARKLLLFGGNIRAIGLKVATKAQIDDILKDVEHFIDLKQAITSFTTQPRARTMKLSEEMAPPDTPIEVKVQSGSKSWVRKTKVISYDGQILDLEWVTHGPEDIFKEQLSTLVKLTVVHKNMVIMFDGSVIEQEFFPTSHIILSNLKMGRIVDRRRHVRVSTEMPILFYHVVDYTNIRRDLRGSCKNISAGGMMLCTGEEIPPHDLIIALFTESQKFRGEKVLGRVVRANLLVTEEGTSFEYGICFVNLKDAVLSTITQFVFDTISEAYEEVEG